MSTSRNSVSRKRVVGSPSAGSTPYPREANAPPQTSFPPTTPGVLRHLPTVPDDSEWTTRTEDQQKQENKEYCVKVTKFAVMLVMIVIFLIAELVGGIFGNSLALLSDAFHMTSDSISHTIGLTAVLLSRRKGTLKLSYGWGRAEVLGAVINSVFLLAVVYFIVVEAIQRFIDPEPIKEPWMVLIVGIAGLIVNVIGLIVFGSDEGLDPTSCLPVCVRNAFRRVCCGLPPEEPSTDEEQKKLVADMVQIFEEDHQECCILAYYREKYNFKNEAYDLACKRDEEEEERLKKSKNPIDFIRRLFGNRSVNMLGVFIHIFGDFLGSVGVIISLTLILTLWGENEDGECNRNCWLIYIDPGLSCLIAFLILCSTTPPSVSIVGVA